MHREELTQGGRRSLPTLQVPTLRGYRCWTQRSWAEIFQLPGKLQQLAGRAQPLSVRAQGRSQSKGQGLCPLFSPREAWAPGWRLIYQTSVPDAESKARDGTFGGNQNQKLGPSPSWAATQGRAAGWRHRVDEPSPLKCICSTPNPQHFRIWLDLEKEVIKDK